MYVETTIHDIFATVSGPAYWSSYQMAVVYVLMRAFHYHQEVFEKCLTQLFYGWMCIVQALLIPAIHEFGALSKLVCVKITPHSTTP